LFFEDCGKRAAAKAEQLARPGWRIHTVMAIAAYNLGDLEAAHRHADGSR